MVSTTDSQSEVSSEQKSKYPKWRWVRLNFETYERLLDLKTKLEGERKGNVTFNKAIVYLLDRYEEMNAHGG
ncbi:hypothetical protein D9Q81_05815 [Candidatus Korarchaeum cryptofilum]|uniref:Uncharacterized protein n=2 Tax=Candidatus Korarchaeum cryptofilum TaxID=498846 RepID=A0A3R9PCA8_9CREN|nr:hypothetical protein D9Q81_05815 [Candidatus Korarchaeum cryptofilum]